MKWSVLFLLLTLLASCGKQSDTAKSLQTDSSLLPYDPEESSVDDEDPLLSDLDSLFTIPYCSNENRSYLNGENLKSLYYQDQRVDYCDLKSTQKKLASSVAMIVESSNLQLIGERDGEKMYQVMAISLKMKEDRLCPEVRYRKGKTVAFCTAFLVGDKKLLTAGHCFKDRFGHLNVRLQNMRLLFSVPENVEAFKGEDGRKYWLVKESQIFKIEKIGSFNTTVPTSRNLDYTILYTDRTTNEYAPLKLGALNTHYSGRKVTTPDVYVMGHPVGLSLKWAPGGVFAHDEGYFEMFIDTFHGNSGSPIFSMQTNEVVGILVAGRDDFQMDTQRGCNKEALYPEWGEDLSVGESAVRIDALIPKLRNGSNL